MCEPGELLCSYLFLLPDHGLCFFCLFVLFYTDVFDLCYFYSLETYFFFYERQREGGSRGMGRWEETGSRERRNYNQIYYMRKSQVSMKVIKREKYVKIIV